jgi:carbonic anhydrase
VHWSTQKRNEYAVDHLAVRLIVVLGHQRCGAKGKAPAHIQSLVAVIKSAVEATVEANVKNVVQALRASTPIPKPKVDSGEVRKFLS